MHTDVECCCLSSFFMSYSFSTHTKPNSQSYYYACKNMDITHFTLTKSQLIQLSTLSPLWFVCRLSFQPKGIILILILILHQICAEFSLICSFATQSNNIGSYTNAHNRVPHTFSKWIPNGVPNTCTKWIPNLEPFCGTYRLANNVSVSIFATSLTV